MSKPRVGKTECDFCGKEMYSNHYRDHLPCEGVKVAEQQRKEQATLSRGGRE